MQIRHERLIGTLGGLLAAGAAAALLLAPSTGQEKFCEAYGLITDPDPVRLGSQRFFVGLDASERNNCMGPFGHYMVTASPEDQRLYMEGRSADGVVWDDCVITWPDGSETTTVEEYIPCTS